MHAQHARSCDAENDGAARKDCRAARENNDADANAPASGAEFLSSIEIETDEFFHHANVSGNVDQ
jgi:hypothetical protein